jgi:tetratricopeptide (TPR) repeat protein
LALNRRPVMQAPQCVQASRAGPAPAKYGSTPLGHHQQDLTYHQVLTLLRDLGDRFGEAGTWNSLGYAHHHRGRHAQAITCYQHALDLYRAFGDRYFEAHTLSRHAAGHLHAARDAWQEALTILDDLDHPDAEQVRAKLHNLSACFQRVLDRSRSCRQ